MVKVLSLVIVEWKEVECNNAPSDRSQPFQSGLQVAMELKRVDQIEIVR